METKDLIKKYWFVGVVALFLVVFIGIYVGDSVKNQPVTVDTKQVDGQYIAYSIDDTDVTADDLYQTLYEKNGASVAFVALERAVFEKAYETTQEMKDSASTNSSSIISYYGESYVKNILANMGYTNGVEDLTQYYIDSAKQDMLVEDYLLRNSELVSDGLGTNGRVIYHILVTVSDVEEVLDAEGNVTGYKANPTEAETESLNTVLAALEEGTMFEQVAYNYSEDTGSKSNGGYIGAINDENAYMYDVAFANESLRLASGEVSEPICSQYGYHIIYNAGSTVEEAIKDYYFISDLESNNPSIVIKAVMEKADELGFEIVSEELKSFIDAQLSAYAEEE